jgi:hypothetical protein
MNPLTISVTINNKGVKFKLFPMSLLNGLETFDLSTNPYWCTCDQKWFLDTIRLTNLANKLIQTIQQTHGERCFVYYMNGISSNI